MTWILSQLKIQGIKGVLDRSGEFTLIKKGKPKSMALFGRNAYGKSGYADAVEYLFSIDGEVEHLGKGSADSEQGGKHAIPHVLAKEKGIIPQVSAEFTELATGAKIAVTRQVNTGRNDIRPSELEGVLGKAPAHRVLRQHDLRRFVVDMAPGQKFEEFARWIGLRSATAILKYLTTAEGTLKDTSVDREFAERLMSIKNHTLETIDVFDVGKILNWCSGEVSKQLGQPFTISKVEEIDNGLAVLRAKREAVANQAKMAKSNLEKVINEFIRDDGNIQNLKASFEKAIEAEDRRDATQAKASESIFQEVWEASQRFLEVQTVEKCPICQTPWENTETGSQESAVVALNKSLSALTQLKEQNLSFQQDIQSVKTCLQQMETRLIEISSFAQTISLPDISTSADEIHTRSAFYQQTLESAKKNQEGINRVLNDCQELANKSIPNALKNLREETSSDSTDNIDISISHLQGLKEAIARLETLTKLQNSIRSVEKEFNKISDGIREEIKKVADNAVDALRDDVRKIYKKIHPGEAVPNIFINLDTEEKTLSIRVNFHSNERIVPPSGYLSEAQINTLGLALFLSSVRLFNKDFPFVFFG